MTARARFIRMKKMNIFIQSVEVIVVRAMSWPEMMMPVSRKIVV